MSQRWHQVGGTALYVFLLTQEGLAHAVASRDCSQCQPQLHTISPASFTPAILAEKLASQSPRDCTLRRVRLPNSYPITRSDNRAPQGRHQQTFRLVSSTPRSTDLPTPRTPRADQSSHTLRRR